MSTPIELLREIYKHVDNGEREKIALVVDAFKSLEVENQTLRTRLEAIPLPEAPASATVKVVDPQTQLEWLVTVRSHAPALIIEEMTQTVERLRQSGYIAFDAYVDQRRAERGQDAPPPDLRYPILHPWLKRQTEVIPSLKPSRPKRLKLPLLVARLIGKSRAGNSRSLALPSGRKCCKKPAFLWMNLTRCKSIPWMAIRPPMLPKMTVRPIRS